MGIAVLRRLQNLYGTYSSGSDLIYGSAAHRASQAESLEWT